MALFGITKIDYCKANALAFSGAYNQFYGVASEPTNTFTNICDVVKNRATLSIEQQVVSKEVLYTSRLVFVTDTDPMLASDYYAFVVTTNAGERILIGAQNRPRTIVTTAQNVAATASDLTAYTTTVEWQTNYRPLRLPVTVTPVTDTRQFDICCGQIARPVAPDLREFEVCCGEIVGEVPPTLLTVRWLNGDGSVLDSKNYYSNQPEPTTTAVPTKAPTSHYSYVFDHWQVQSVIGTVKTYEPVFNEVANEIYVPITTQGNGPNMYVSGNAYNSTTVSTLGYTGKGDSWLLYFNNRLLYPYYCKFTDTEECTYLSADWSAFNAAFPDMHPIYHPDNPTFQIGYYSDEWQGSI